MDYREFNKKKKEKRKKYLIKKDKSLISIIGQFFITLFSWGVLVYCFRNIFYSIYLFSAGYEVNLALPEELIYNLLVYSFIVLSIVGLWIWYNKKMFGGKDRRKQYKSWSNEQIESLYEINEEELNSLQKGKNLYINFDEKNKLSSIEIISR